MPKYTFECTCGLQFTRTLKLDNHKAHICPDCSQEAPRLLEGFGFAFAPGGTAPANSGVSKHDYPTADYAVGSDSEKRWAEHNARERVKNQVRKEGGTHALIRKNGKGYVEYEAGTPDLLKKRRALVRESQEVSQKTKPNS